MQDNKYVKPYFGVGVDELRQTVEELRADPEYTAVCVRKIPKELDDGEDDFDYYDPVLFSLAETLTLIDELRQVSGLTTTGASSPVKCAGYIGNQVVCAALSEPSITLTDQDGYVLTLPLSEINTLVDELSGVYDAIVNASEVG